MSDSAEPFADEWAEDDPFARSSAANPSARDAEPGRPPSGRPGRRPATADAKRVVYVPAPPNPWKGTALLLAGFVLGGGLASMIWGGVFLALVIEGDISGAGLADVAAMDELDTARMQRAFSAEPNLVERLGPITAVTVNDRTYAADTPWDVYYYDATGERASGLVKVRYDEYDRFVEASLTLEDGGEIDLDLSNDP